MSEEKGTPRDDFLSRFASSYPNPYHWPDHLRYWGVRYNGVIVQRAPVDDDSLVHVEKIRALPMKEDDIILAAYPKCGTHWLSEILTMLLKGSTTYDKTSKRHSMIEFVNDLPSLDSVPSPRLFNSHLFFAHLPEQIVEKRVKIVHVVRNAKDTAVSWFHHMKQAATSPEFNFDNFLKGYTTEDYTTNGHQFNYLRQMSEFEKDNPDHPIIHMRYEDLKKDPVPELQRLAKFLGQTATEDFCREVVEACSFKKLKEAEEGRKGEGNASIFRKGLVGDWKNSFTVAQNEMFDEFIKQQEEKLPRLNTKSLSSN